MKKTLVILIFIAVTMSGMAQQIHYHFAETVESGQTLYFLKGYYGPQDVMVTYPCYHDTIIYNSSGASTQITTYYYGHDEPSGDLVIPSTITHNDTVYTITGIGYNAFWKCTNITSLTLPNTLSFILQGAFASCTGISGEVVIPDSLKFINDDAFRWCENLNSVVFGCALEQIGFNAFKDCHSLEHISAFPESLTRIEEQAFKNCYNLSGTIVIPLQMTKIENSAFAYCNISSVVIPEGVTTIEPWAFVNCPITELDIPSSASSISIYAFSRSYMQSITVNEANPVFDSRDNCNALIQTETNTLFMGCKYTTIPDDIVAIGSQAFSSNELDFIIIPNSVERLERGAFSGCNSLPTITLPSSISYIGKSALNCCGLTSIVCKSPTPPVAFNHIWEYGYDNSFMGVSRDIPIYIPIGTTEAYRNASGWDYFSNFIETEINLESEWYYEILNDDGSITYQHLEYAADTTIGNERPKVVVRSNTQYDRDTITEVTHEYVYEENGIVYWWNKDLEEFTILYDLAANAGDEWEIKVGTESLFMHVDAVEYFELNGLNIKMLRVSDAEGIFNGDIVCSFGHMTSFFPERLMNRNADFEVNGLRCYWVNDVLLYHNGDEDCDAIHSELQGLNEDGPSTGSGTFAVYPNPANGVVFVRLPNPPAPLKGGKCDSPTADQIYRITNLMGQTLLQGRITADNQQINIVSLPAGMYFITFAGETLKFVVK